MSSFLGNSKQCSHDFVFTSPGYQYLISLQGRRHIISATTKAKFLLFCGNFKTALTGFAANALLFAILII